MSQDYDQDRATEPVPLSPIVQATLEALLAGPGPVLQALRNQIPFTQMEEGCPCGCTSVDLWVDESKIVPAPPHDGRPLAEGYYVNTDAYAGVLLFTSRGYLRTLEVHTWLEEPIRVWPPLDHLEVSPASKTAP